MVHLANDAGHLLVMSLVDRDDSKESSKIYLFLKVDGARLQFMLLTIRSTRGVKLAARDSVAAFARSNSLTQANRRCK